MSLSRELHRKLKIMSRNEMECYLKTYYEEAHNSGVQKGLRLAMSLFLEGLRITQGIGPVLSTRIASNVNSLFEEHQKNEAKPKLYWVSAIVHYHGDDKPSLIAISDSFLKYEKALEQIDFMRAHPNYRTLSAWIDVFDENKNKTTIYHQSFIDAFGNIAK